MKVNIEVQFYCPVPGEGNLPVLQAEETISASNESEVFEKLHTRNSVLQYVNNAYWRIKDEEIRKRYFNWTAFVLNSVQYPEIEEGMIAYFENNKQL